MFVCVGFLVDLLEVLPDQNLEQDSGKAEGRPSAAGPRPKEPQPAGRKMGAEHRRCPWDLGTGGLSFFGFGLLISEFG